MSEPAKGTDAIEDTAIEWFTLLRSDAVSAKQLRAFERWRKRDPAHAAAFRSIEAMWGELDALGDGKLEELVSRRRALKKLAVVGLAGTGLGAGWALSPPGLFADYRTATGERRTIALPDGTSVELGPLSALSLGNWTAQRLLRLERGEIFVTVAHDPGRPFVVEARDGAIVARGTAFNVKLDAGTVEVATQEGVVEVRGAGGAPATLRAAEAVSYDGARLTPVRPVDLAAVEGWRTGRLVFRDAAMPRVARELERYLPGRVVVLGAAGERRVTAVFEADRPERALDLIARSFGLTVRRWTPWLTLITAAG